MQALMGGEEVECLTPYYRLRVTTFLTHFTGSCTRPEILHAQLLLEEGRAAPISMDHGTSLTVQCSAGLVVSEPATPVCNNGTWSSLPICVQGKM